MKNGFDEPSYPPGTRVKLRCHMAQEMRTDVGRGVVVATQFSPINAVKHGCFVLTERNGIMRWGACYLEPWSAE